ncbi:MAG: hypothetical protein IKO35_05880, partial [Elusimicrobiaceae bacterium]|nr:hypothetical protein [Elusimicrobiaceae bacterium]
YADKYETNHAWVIILYAEAALLTTAAAAAWGRPGQLGKGFSVYKMAQALLKDGLGVEDAAKQVVDNYKKKAKEFVASRFGKK